MAVNEENDVDNIVNMANTYVKGLNMTRSQLLHPTKDFIFDFYQKYLMTVDEMVGSLFKCDCQGLLGDAMFPLNEDIILYVYLFVNNITTQFSIDYFKLSDIYQPTNRSKTTVKLLLNLLLYMQSNECAVKGIINEINQFLVEHDSFKIEIDEMKNNIGVLSCEIAQIEENYIKAKNEADIVNKCTQELEKQKLQDEIAKEKVVSELDTLDETLNQLEDYLGFLKNDVGSLQNQIVDKDDFIDSQERKIKLEKKVAEMQSASAEYDKVICSKKAEVDHLERLMKLADSTDCSVKVIEKLEELKAKTENERTLNTKRSMQLEKLNSRFLNCKKAEEHLTAELFSQSCKYDGVLAHIRNEKNFTLQEIEKEKEFLKNLMAKYATEEEEIIRLYEESERELQEVYKIEDETYKYLLQQENLLVTTFDAELQQLINIFSK